MFPTFRGEFFNPSIMSIGESYDEERLVKELTQHDEAAFRLLYDAYRSDIYAYSMSFLKRKEYAEEIVQEVFMKVWIHREKLDPNRSFKSYLFTIARNLTFNFLRKAANDRHMMAEVFYFRKYSFNPVDRKINEEAFERMKQEAVTLLPPRRKRIFEMSRFEGKSYEEISKELDISISTVKNQMSKALETMREYMRVHGDITIPIYIVLTSWW